ncbi:zinc finger C2HC domain-containing protein 1C-like [Argopecten irradians]|uniref:zinc finger C2HC domain-containing protein 1C-like n=1 Tax=Argopecten irradians TaxID=31199 RepID=UPI0037145106
MISGSVVDRSPVYGGSSNYQNVNYSNTTKRTNMDGGQQKMSRLQLMQMQYQQRMLKDKEEKLVNMYQENQQRALNRVQSKGMAREFFRERREMEANGNLSQMPSIEQHYQQKRRENGVHVNSNSPHGTISRHNSFGSNQSQRQHMGYQRQNSGGPQGYKNKYQKRSSAGRDKSNPLAPIERPPSHENNDFFPRKPQIHGRPKTKDSDKRTPHEGQTPKSAPHNDFYHDDDGSPPPNLAHLKNAQKQKVNAFGYGGRPPKASPSKTSKPSNFQQFQQDRDQERADRLRRHQQTLDRGIGGGYEYEDEKENESEANSQRESALDIDRKQKEIMEKIARQQAELERIRQQRAAEEEEERKERERRKKREEERRRKMKEDEERRKREEKERREMEEEEAKRRSEQQRKTNQSRSRCESQYHDNGSEGYSSHMSSYPAEPTPPPQPKPSRKPINRRPPPQQNPLAMSSESAYDSKPIASARGGGNVSLFEQAARMEGAFDTEHIKQVKCSNCGRKFNADRIDKHRQFCGNLTKKRKVLDGTKMRVQGTDMEKYIGKNGTPKKSTPSGKKGNWRKQHEEFVNNIRYARKVAQIQKEGGSLSNLPPPPPAENADYVQCPHCNRKYNEMAAARHIPKCKDIKARPTALKRKR